MLQKYSWRAKPFFQFQVYTHWTNMSAAEKANITDIDLIKMYLWAKDRSQDGDFDLKTFEG